MIFIRAQTMVPNLALLPFGAEPFFVVGGPMHCRRFSSILALHLLGAICIPQLGKPKKMSSNIDKISQGGKSWSCCPELQCGWGGTDWF